MPPPPLMTDPATAALVAAQDGDPAAFETFIRLTRTDVTRYCHHLGDPGQVDDLVQDTYLRALRSLGGFRGDGSATRWILAIARRACAQAIEHQQRARRTELTRRPTVDATATVDLGLLIDHLPDDQRDAFVLTQILGHTYDQAAEICDCPVGTIRSRVARARAQLVVQAGDERTA